MRKLKPKKVSELLLEFYKKVQQKQKKDPLSTWISVLGKQIENETEHISLTKGILYVEIKNPYLKNDLSNGKKEILNKLQILDPRILKIIFK
ncbi:MAG: hypothetical protein CMP65_02055 [Flavobacteriales bacterium]|nr:hypothetical protein [Flavobacteriales bacterium]|tara:strand:- start:438 stop:713 length:276 start_codon:yes stop_codon:yes gene_type:complete